MKDNKGYTLIEMIIVIAIIAIMTGAAMVTITILHNAKAKEASITLETALSETQKNAKGKMCVVADTQQPDYKFALAVYKSGSKYYVKKGVENLNADFGEGYWSDHWTYNLDLVDAYLSVYPEKEETMLFDEKDYTYYESKATGTIRIIV